MTAPFDLQALAKVPLARAALRLLDFALDHRSLDDTFQRHRGLALERKIAFPEFVRLIADALLGHSAPSAHQTFRRGIENGTLECSVQALYGKLRRMPLWSHTTCLAFGEFKHSQQGIAGDEPNFRLRGPVQHGEDDSLVVAFAPGRRDARHPLMRRHAFLISTQTASLSICV